MSETNYFVGKYNFSRRALNHRRPHDFNYDINKNPMSFKWRISIKNLVVGNIIRNVGIWHCCFALGFGLFINEALAFYKRDDDLAFNHVFNSQRDSTHAHYVLHAGNQLTNMGRWNNNFMCWEKDPYCGRDFA